MAKKKKTISKKSQKSIEHYDHKDKKRLNNPPVGLVDSHTDNVRLKKQEYKYDPHLDPQLQWAGKAEHTSFEVPTVSLHVHERIDPLRIIEQVRKEPEPIPQLSLFQTNKETKGLSKALEFYRHKENWSNRLIAGDSLLVMNSLTEKEGMGGHISMIYFDPPYGIKYGSNFQPFVNKREVKDGKDEDLTAEPEMIKAFRDTWELGIHSFLTYMRDRLLLAKQLLSENGSIFVQISDENVHHVRELMDEIFGPEKFVAIIAFKTATNQNAKRIQRLYDYLVWYGKSEEVKFRAIYRQRTVEEVENIFNNVEEETGRRYKAAQLNDKYTPEQMKNLRDANRLVESEKYAKRYEDDFELTEYDNVWYGTIISTFSKEKVYAVQTSTVTIERCILMTTDPGDIVLDITCGSGTTAFVAEKFGRRWITCDTSRVSLALAKQRLLTSNFDYYKLAYPDEGVGSGFEYEEAKHITLNSVAYGEPESKEKLFDKPVIDNKKARVTGPFTVEAVPAPVVRAMEEVEHNTEVEADISVSRSGETYRHNTWVDELKNTGIRLKGGKRIEFIRMETARGLRYVQAEGETKGKEPQKVFVVFAPEHAPLEQRIVELAWEEAKPYKPDILLFCAIQFDEEAAKDIDEMNPEITKCQFLKVQMNADLLTEDLKKKRSSNESFWLIGQPDARIKEIKNGEYKGKYQVEVYGFDYYNPKTGTVDSGGKDDIAMWMLDTDYDGRSLFPSQVFFPMAGLKEGWATIAKNLKAEIDEEKIQAFNGTVSLPFSPGKAVAVKIIDARGIESLKIIRGI